MNKRMTIWLNPDEIEFIKWFAKRDGISFMQEMRYIFQTELDNCRRLYEDEMKAEKNM